MVSVPQGTVVLQQKLQGMSSKERPLLYTVFLFFKTGSIYNNRNISLYDEVLIVEISGNEDRSVTNAIYLSTCAIR